jgi:hypothetical protein
MAAELELENQSRDTVSPPQFHTQSDGGTPTIHSHALHVSLLIRRKTASFRFKFVPQSK